MITMAMIGKIRRLHFRDGLTISEIARRTSLARNTVKKWLRAKPGVEPKYRRCTIPHKLAAFVLVVYATVHLIRRRKRLRRSHIQ